MKRVLTVLGILAIGAIFTCFVYAAGDGGWWCGGYGYYDRYNPSYTTSQSVAPTKDAPTQQVAAQNQAKQTQSYTNDDDDYWHGHGMMHHHHYYCGMY